jgi:H+-transporting ATPase
MGEAALRGSPGSQHSNAAGGGQEGLGCNTNPDFQEMSVEDTIKILSTDLSEGLSSEEAKKRLRECGYNEVPEEKTRSIVRFLKKFWGITAWMLELIIVLSFVLGKYSDLYTVTVLLFVNSVIGFFQEERSSKAVEMLKKELQVNAKVLREGSWKTFPAREIVPGDVVRVRTGDFVPADVKLFEGEVEVDQSALTGESMSVEKRLGDILYSGSMIRRGEATGIVALTGTKTYFGRTVQLVSIARPRLHMEDVISSVLRWLLIIVAVLLGIAVSFSVYMGINLVEILPLMLVLLLGAIPVALPAMFTVSMALGSTELVKRGVLVTKLSAVEDAASMDVLCVDKTGTITMNKLSIAEVIPLNGYDERDSVLYGAIASQEANQDPIDLAFISSAKEKGLLSGSFTQAVFVPFDPNTRRTEAIVHKDGNEFKVMKGAVSVIAELCHLSKDDMEGIRSKVEDLARRGYRVLAVAKSASDGPQMIGLVALYDTIRPDSEELIKELRGLGVSIKMLTGDALPIAKEVAEKVGLGGNVVRISEVKEIMKEDSEKAAELVEMSDGFAEIYPEDKYLIVKSLQAKGHIVGMTGDGVNDAPALKQAEVGIAVSNATDVAKGSSSAVLTGEGLSNIVDLVKVGRAVFERINTWILNKISRTILKTVFVVGAFLMTGMYVISSSAMLAMMFFTDFIKISISTDNVRWSRKPNVWNVKGLVKVAVVLGSIMVVEALWMLYIGFTCSWINGNRSVVTLSFQMLFYFAIFSILSVRERGHFWESRPSEAFLGSVIFGLVCVTAMTTVGIPGLFDPLPFSITLVIILYSSVLSFLLNDEVKYALVRKHVLVW